MTFVPSDTGSATGRLERRLQVVRGPAERVSRPMPAVLDILWDPAVDAATPDAFKAVFGRVARGIAVVTADGSAGPCGMTASSLTSLSLEPPLALVCLDNGSRTLSVAAESGHFGVSVLKLHHRDPSSAFAQPGNDPERFARFAFETRHGVPVLADALAWAACKVAALVRAGDHTIAIGLVQAAGHDEGEPLVWHRGSYRGLAA